MLSNLPAPWLKDFSGRGLVLGYVQSGKTANYISVIAKAADAGYRLIIILSGIHNNLRRQTQKRLDDQLVRLAKGRWFRLTGDIGDFGDPGNSDALLAQDSLRLLAVVKKNKSRLENLVNWLSEASAAARTHCPILVIDDEADQASVNTSDDERSTINALLMKLLAQPKVAYVGYTATPFANIFVDPSVPEDLYPRDFIVDLPRPPAYFGPERLFGAPPGDEAEAEFGDNGLDAVRIVPLAEVENLRPPRKKEERADWSPSVTRTLTAAIGWFLLASATRRARGQVDKYSSMLLHTTQLAELHMKFKEPVEEEAKRLAKPAAKEELRRLWESETRRVTAEELNEVPVPFERAFEHIPEVAENLRVVVDNYLSDERLDYSGDAENVIVIGGNTLSRGLTLEGLVVSYFVRTANAYDTLLQMGRWFGYRRGYSDLPRIWLTSELRDYFRFLALVESEIRIDVERYELEDLRPSDFAVRVQTHPQLAITSALKMRQAEQVYVSYSGRRLQTILFDRDAKWLERNWSAGEDLVMAVGGISGASRGHGGRFVWEGVPAAAIKKFLTTYHFHEASQELSSERIVDYIDKENSRGELRSWNVALVSLDPPNGDKAVSFADARHRRLGLINRSAVPSMHPYANIKSLMSRVDRVIDLPDLSDAQRSLDDAELQRLRPKKIGLIVLYLVDGKSTPRRVNGAEPKSRVDLNAESNVLGVGIVFPDAGSMQSKVSYMAVPLPLGDVEEHEEIDAEQLDTEDSFTAQAQL